MFRRENRRNNPSIYEKSADLVEKILKEGADPNFIRESDNYHKLPALCFAVENNYPEVINIFRVFLKDPRTDINNADIIGTSPLMYACYDYVSDEVGVELVCLLLKHPKMFCFLHF